MQSKTTRAFRTISEAAEELELQAHVLRFWESKFSQINPIKRAGGRRLYRPEDIDLLRGIKILLHEEKHPIKDVQKIIRLKGPNQVVELGRSIKRAARPKDVKETVLVPERIVAQKRQASPVDIAPATASQATASQTAKTNSEALAAQEASSVTYQGPVVLSMPASKTPKAPVASNDLDVTKLKTVLSRLVTLRDKWDKIDLKAGE